MMTISTTGPATRTIRVTSPYTPVATATATHPGEEVTISGARIDAASQESKSGWLRTAGKIGMAVALGASALGLTGCAATLETVPADQPYSRVEVYYGPEYYDGGFYYHWNPGFSRYERWENHERWEQHERMEHIEHERMEHRYVPAPRVEVHGGVGFHFGGRHR